MAVPERTAGVGPRGVRSALLAWHFWRAPRAKPPVSRGRADLHADRERGSDRVEHLRVRHRPPELARCRPRGGGCRGHGGNWSSLPTARSERPWRVVPLGSRHGQRAASRQVDHQHALHPRPHHRRVVRGGFGRAGPPMCRALTPGRRSDVEVLMAQVGDYRVVMVVRVEKGGIVSCSVSCGRLPRSGLRFQSSASALNVVARCMRSPSGSILARRWCWRTLPSQRLAASVAARTATARPRLSTLWRVTRYAAYPAPRATTHDRPRARAPGCCAVAWSTRAKPTHRILQTTARAAEKIRRAQR